ncbi:hypothetical protein [Rossellomorea marisflavi]|uniref:hypothetical protein n=1 Tax=Rossellomorea marisflavi TaxID=189381 RepID=UPI003514810B
MIRIKTASIVLHVLFSMTLLLQLGAVLSISSTFDYLTVPIHFSIDGTADSFGTIQDYLILIGVNILVYAISVIGAKFVRKTNPQQFDFFHTELEKQKAAVKIKIFAQVLAVHFSASSRGCSQASFDMHGTRGATTISTAFISSCSSG